MAGGTYTKAQILATILTNWADGSSIDASELRAEVNKVIAELRDLRGVQDCSTNPNYPAAEHGDTYVVSVAGKIGGASGVPVQVGAVLRCTADAASGNHATVGSSWVIENNGARYYADGLTVQQVGVQGIPDDAGEDDELRYHHAPMQAVAMRELDTVRGTTNAIAIPSGWRFYPYEAWLVCSSYSAPGAKGNIDLGYAANDDNYTPTPQTLNNITAVGDCIAVAITDHKGVTDLLATVETATASGTLSVRVVWFGIMLKDQ